MVSTKFLGFIDIEHYFVIGGVGLGVPMLNVATFIATFFMADWYRIPKKYFKFIGLFLLIALYGVIYPAILGYETITQAILASKEFWTVSILVYLAAYRKKIDVKILIKAIKFIGVYLAFVYIFYLFFEIAPPSYVEEHNVRGYFPTYISLALFLYYVELKNNYIKLFKFNIIGIILFTGMILAGHTSLVLGTIFSLFVLEVFYKNNRFSLGRALSRIFVLFGLIAVVFISFFDMKNNVFNNREMIAQGVYFALASRDTYNQFRWEAISDKPIGGYGFIHKTAPMTIKLRTSENNRFAESFGVIDSGYVDLLIKFGYLGTALYLYFWISVVFPVLLRPEKYHAIQLGMAGYLMQYFLVNYTWSVFTFSHGLIPAFIAVFLLLEQQKIYSKSAFKGIK